MALKKCWVVHALRIAVGITTLAIVGFLFIGLPGIFPEYIPLLSVSPDPIYFALGNMKVGETAVQTFSISKWNVSADQPWITVNRINGTDSGIGPYSLNITSINGAISYVSNYTVNVNMTGVKNINFWIYADNVSNLSEYEIFMSNITDFSKYFQVILSPPELVYGWNHVTIPIENFVNNGGDVWATTKLICLRVVSTPGKTVNVMFDDLRFDMVARPKIMIDFDDGYLSVYQNASTVLNNNGQNANIYAITSAVNDTDYMSLANLTSLYSLGWDISSHTENHLDLTFVNTSTLSSELNNSKNWLHNYSFTRSEMFFTYPFGSYNDTIITALKNTGYKMARTASGTNKTKQAHYMSDDGDAFYKMKILSVNNETTVEFVKGEINETINSSGLLILVFHRIVNNTADVSTKYLTSDLQNISDYLVTRSSDIDVITISQYWATIQGSSPSTN